ncbi:MAG: DUF6159 family protein [bacterium]|nr:DUF6159 family protein [bacterium]
MNLEEKIPTPSVSNTGSFSQVPPSAPLKIGKLKASRMIVKESWNILKQDKELVWFPVLSMISSLVALILMGILFFFIVMDGDIHALDNLKESGMNVLGYVILFVYYLVMFFITNYFLAGVYIIVQGRFGGQNLSLTDGINGASRNLGKIFLWSLISATVGVILRIISDKFKVIGRIVASLLGAAWGILTYFSLPSLIIGQKSVKESFRESATLIRKTWGETIIVNFGVALFFGILMFFGLALCIGIAVLMPVKGVLILVSVLFVIFMIAITIISSVLGAIFKLALYEFALTGNVPKGFTSDLIIGAIRSGK